MYVVKGSEITGFYFPYAEEFFASFDRRFVFFSPVKVGIRSPAFVQATRSIADLIRLVGLPGRADIEARLWIYCCQQIHSAAERRGPR